MTPEERQREHDLIEKSMLDRIKELSNVDRVLYTIPEGSTRAIELATWIENYKEFIKARQFGRTISKLEMDAPEEVRSTGEDISSLFGFKEDDRDS